MEKQNEPKLFTTEETERLAKLKPAELETDEDLTRLADLFYDHPDDDEAEDHQPETEQSLEFLTGGERYIKG